MAELESVMRRLDVHAGRLKESTFASEDASVDEERRLLVEGLALVSEALVRVGRDVRFLKLRFADKA